MGTTEQPQKDWMKYKEYIAMARAEFSNYHSTDSPGEDNGDDDYHEDYDVGVFAAARSPYSRGDGIFSAVSNLGALDDDDDSDSNSLSDSDDDDDDDDGVQLSSAKLSGWNKKDNWSKNKWPTPEPSEKKTKEPTKSWPSPQP